MHSPSSTSSHPTSVIPWRYRKGPVLTSLFPHHHCLSAHTYNKPKHAIAPPAKTNSRATLTSPGGDSARNRLLPSPGEIRWQLWHQARRKKGSSLRLWWICPYFRPKAGSNYEILPCWLFKSYGNSLCISTRSQALGRMINSSLPQLCEWEDKDSDRSLWLRLSQLPLASRKL